MATYSRTGLVSATGPRFMPMGKDVASIEQTITVATTDLALNALMSIGYVPRNCRVLDVIISCTDLDTNGTPALVLAVGDAADDDRFITASTVGQTGGRVSAGNTAASAATFAAHTGYTDDTLISVKATTAAATAATGTIKATILYEATEPPV